jgi:hypothetical protein
VSARSLASNFLSASIRRPPVLTADSIIFGFCLLVVFIVRYLPSLTTGTRRFRILQTYLLTSALIVPRATIKRTSELYIFLALQSRDDFLSVHFSRVDGPFWVVEQGSGRVRQWGFRDTAGEDFAPRRFASAQMRISVMPHR